ncbi:MAG: lipopolysaccharide biosynthesis protein [Hyphomicrobiaceae bacterium]|nr:lipopolysaccharide biosynthesis protein [Hyphomicrobiaceae bacterium]
MSETATGGDGLGRRSITAMLWGTGGSALRIVLQIVSQIVLARLLGPEAYGVFAVALVVVLLSSLFADVGLAYGLIQKPAVSPEDVRFVFTWQVGLGVVMTGLVYLAAPWIAGLYGDQRLGPALAALSVSCLVNAAAATSGALLRRDLDFKTLNIASVASYAAGFLGIGIPLAMAGAGVTALVAAYLAQTTIQAVVQYIRLWHPVRPLIWQPGAPAMLDFGATVLATNLVNWAMNGIDRAIVGSWLGLASAGLYATAYNLISTPLVAALALLQSVFYSASAKLQDEPEQMRRALTILFGAVTLFVAPVFAGAAASAETLMQVLYGSKWAGGGEVLAPLALAMPVYLLMGLAIPVLWASGSTRKELQLQVPIALVWVAALWAVAQSGSLGALGWAVLLLFLMRAGVIVGATLKAVSMRWDSVWQTCRPGLLVASMAGLAALVADRALGPWLGHGPSLLAVDMLAAGSVMAVGLRLVGRSIGDDLTHLLRQLADRLPRGMGHAALRLLLGL